MKKLFALFILLLCAIVAGAQSVPTTPNIGLYIPYHGTANWDTYVNSNSTNLDLYLSGGLQLPRLHIGQLLLTQYLDYTGLGSAPTNPAVGVCRVYFDLGTGQWKGIDSTGASCSPSGNVAGTTGAMGYYASNGTAISPSLCTVDVSGNLTCASFVSNGVGTPKFDMPEGTSPGNPSSGKIRFYADSTSHQLVCLTSAGGNCFPSATWGSIGGTLGSQTDLNTALSLKAPLASPTFTGTVTLPDGSTATTPATHVGQLTVPNNGAFIIQNPASDVSEYWISRGYASFTGIGWQVFAQNGSTSGGGIQIYENDHVCNTNDFDLGAIVLTDYTGADIFCAGTPSSGTPQVTLPGGATWDADGFIGSPKRISFSSSAGISPISFFINGEGTNSLALLQSTGNSISGGLLMQNVPAGQTQIPNCLGTITSTYHFLQIGATTVPANNPSFCLDDTTAYVQQGTTNTMLPIVGKVKSGTAAMGTSSISANTCATVVTVAATGVATTDTIAWSFNAAPGTGYTSGLVVNTYPTANNVNFLVCNPTAGSLTPAAATLNWKVTR